MIVAGLVDQLDFANTDLLINARAVFLDGLRGSHWATNGCVLLTLLQRPCYRRLAKNQDKPLTSQRPIAPARSHFKTALPSCGTGEPASGEDACTVQPPDMAACLRPWVPLLF